MRAEAAPFRMPRADGSEEAIIGTLVTDPSILTELQVAGLEPEHFADRGLRLLYGAALNLSEMQEPIDSVSVAAEACKHPDAADYPPLALQDEAERCRLKAPEISDLAYHAGAIITASRRRTFIGISQKLYRQLGDPAQDIDEVLDTALDQFSQMRIRGGKGLEDDFPKLLAQRVLDIKAGKAGTPSITSGYKVYDKLTGGFRRGAFIVIAAPPGKGKSALALQMATKMAVNTGQVLPIFSLEMLAEDTVNRSLSQALDWDTMKIHSGDYPRSMYGRLDTVADMMKEARIKLDRTNARSIGAIRAVSKMYAARYGQLCAVMVDFLQLVKGTGESREREVANVSNGLKDLAMELACPVIAMSSLNRAGQSAGVRPTMAALRDSGQIESDADTIIFLYSDTAPLMGGVDEIEWIVAKNRGGGTGSVMSEFRRTSTRFNDKMWMLDGEGKRLQDPDDSGREDE